MTQDDVYRKVGRGGAGNFFSKSTANAQAETEKDLEAQKDASAVPSTADAAASPVSHPARAGRGGAGNYTESQSAAAEHERSVAQETAKAVKASRPTGNGYAGRGGAGNWKGGGEGRDDAVDEGERSRLEEMEKKAREVVDQGLKMPEKVVTAKDRKKGLGLAGEEF